MLAALASLMWGAARLALARPVGLARGAVASAAPRSRAPAGPPAPRARWLSTESSAAAPGSIVPSIAPLRQVEQRPRGYDGLKRYKPITPGRRHRVTVDKSHLWKGAPLKSLTVGLVKSGGRNNYGRICTWHRGGGNKRKYRLIDFKRDRLDEPATVERLEYDPNRSSFIALVRYPDLTPSYILAPDALTVGQTIIASCDPDRTDIAPGNSLPLAQMPTGVAVHNIELYPGRGGQLVRGAGTSASVIAHEENGRYSLLRLPSGEQRRVLSSCRATIGRVSNPVHKHRKLGKAGAARWIGRRPHVRGVAMNPVDHPHGGGACARARAARPGPTSRRATLPRAAARGRAGRSPPLPRQACCTGRAGARGGGGGGGASHAWTGACAHRAPPTPAPALRAPRAGARKRPHSQQPGRATGRSGAPSRDRPASRLCRRIDMGRTARSTPRARVGRAGGREGRRARALRHAAAAGGNVDKHLGPCSGVSR